MFILADSGFDIDFRIIIAVLFVVFSAIKWLKEKIQGVGGESDYHEDPDQPSGGLDALYESYREQIQDRQSEVYSQEPAYRFHEEVAPVNVPPPLPLQAEPTPSRVSPPPAKESKPTLSAAEEQALALIKAGEHVKRKGDAHRRSPSLRALLSRPESTRKAILLQEVLGTPKGLQ